MLAGAGQDRAPTYRRATKGDVTERIVEEFLTDKFLASEGMR